MNVIAAKSGWHKIQVLQSVNKQQDLLECTCPSDTHGKIECSEGKTPHSTPEW